jgi:hypothetical protein
MVRSPHLHEAVRAFCLAAFAELGPEAAQREVPFVLEEHESGLLEYRPLIRDHVESRAYWLAALPDAKIAIDELRRDPAAAIFARGHAGPESSEGRALFQAILLPVLVRTAEACGGFDWEDGAFARIYADLERSLYGRTRVYGAVAPLVGISAGGTVDLAPGLAVRPATAEELANGLAPEHFGDEPDRSCVLALARELPGEAEESPDAPAELADAVTALRLATGAPVAGGPVVFERLDWHPFGMRPMLGIAATEPGGEPGRLDPWRGRLAGDLIVRLGSSEGDPELAEAVERWELSLLEDEPLRSERLRESLAALLGGEDGLWAAAMRATMLLADGDRERSSLIDRLRALGRGERRGAGSVAGKAGVARPEDRGAFSAPGVQVADDVRRAIVETLLHDDRARLVTALDESMLGLRPPPAGYFSARAVAG